MSSVISELPLNPAIFPEADLSRLAFRAETNAAGPAIDLVWTIPQSDDTANATTVDDVGLLILRRERRFPGRNRRGLFPVLSTVEDVSDGDVVYDSNTFAFDFEETRNELEGGLRISTTRQYLYRGTPRDRLLVRTIRREFLPDQVTALRTTVRALDRSGIVAGNIYYYTAFVFMPAENPPREFVFSRLTQSSALATGHFGHSFFRDLPQALRGFDTQTPPHTRVARVDQNKGQLQRLLESLDVHVHMFRGFAEGLLDLHNPRRVDSRLLPHLAQLIGWKLWDHPNEDGQRSEITFASEFYRTVGTRSSVAAMINRLTGWDTQVREFARNVLLSFDTARIEELESGHIVYLDGSLAPNPAAPPILTGRRIPVGSVDTSDAEAMFKLRSRDFDDRTAYTYDCGRLDSRDHYQRDDDVLYNRETIGVYIVPDVATEPFMLQEEWERIRQILTEFLPIQVRAVFVVQPGVVVKEEYDATRDVTEEFDDVGTLAQTETWGEGADERIDRIPEWHWFVSNDLSHLTIDTTLTTIDANSRTWHTGLAKEL